MMRPNLRLVVFLAVFSFAPRISLAAPPNATPGNEPNLGSPSNQPPGRVQEFQGLGIDRRAAAFAGNVLDVADRPIAGVQVKLFLDGQLAGTSVTDGLGHYDLKVPYDAAADITVLLWFVAPDHLLTPKELVIRESKASRENGLISPCVPRADLLPGRQFRVYLFDSQSRNKELSELNCLP
jgi:hypothetical protein